MIPTKVQSLIRVLERAEYRPWTEIRAEERDGLWIVSAIRPGNVFTEERVSLYMGVHAARTIPGTDIRMRASQRFQGGHLYRFGGDVEIRTYRDLVAVR